MSKILVIDTERGAGGFRSMKNVKVLDACEDDKKTTFQKVEEYYWMLAKNPAALKEYSHVVLDTITALAGTTRHAMILNPEKAASGELWERRGLYASDTRGDYRSSNDLVARLLQHYRRLPVHTIFICHEEDRMDPAGYMKRGPSVSPGLLKEVIYWSHVIAHLGQTSKTITLASGEQIPAGTRRLRIEPDNRYMAKARHRVDLPPLPPVILRPRLADVLTIMDSTGETAAWATIYGPPGVGKTSLVVGASYSDAPKGESAASEVVTQETTEKEEAHANA